MHSLEIPRIPVVPREVVHVLRGLVFEPSAGYRASVAAVEPIIVVAPKDCSRGEVKAHVLHVPPAGAAVAQYHIVDDILGSLELQAPLKFFPDKLVEVSPAEGVSRVVEVVYCASPVRRNDVNVDCAEIAPCKCNTKGGCDLGSGRMSVSLTRPKLCSCLGLHLVQEGTGLPASGVEEENQGKDGRQKLHVAKPTIWLALGKKCDKLITSTA